ncbi:ATP-binding protein [Aurantibacillus circumpalustris]|uniref:ATP-binding protein n=1 Tax=Aurantibacillus circumpalustris TaxID=3036359 RepID=UPI00295A66CC|nr:ATP-binding protein [Aurantibacillus circumpalustris]
MITRSITPLIEKYSKEFPVIVILGPRQVGKTTLVKIIAKSLKKKTHYLDLERNSDFSTLNRDAEEYLSAYTNECVLIDEVQRMPTLFPLLRALVDENRKPARFIITGSASPELLKGASESLAGRVYYFYLNPIGLHELPGTISIKKHWFRGGFPKALTLKNNELSSGWLDAFITTYIERDLAILFDIKFSPIVMRKLWGMLAHLQGGILNAEKLGSSLDVSGTTIKRYIDYLEGAFLIRRLPPYFVNVGKRLVKSPKVYINDSGILHHLLRIGSEKELLNNPSVGGSWEGYVITQIINAAPKRIDTYYYRTQVGAECDLVLVHGNNVKACIEIKLSKAPVPSKGFYISVSDLNCKQNFIISSADQDYKNKQGTVIVGLDTFIKKYLPKL